MTFTDIKDILRGSWRVNEEDGDSIFIAIAERAGKGSIVIRLSQSVTSGEVGLIADVSAVSDGRGRWQDAAADVVFGKVAVVANRLFLTHRLPAAGLGEKELGKAVRALAAQAETVRVRQSTVLPPLAA